MQIKNELRKKYKNLRKVILDKNRKDEEICKRFISSDLFSTADEVLCFYPLKNEINTLPIISATLKLNKKLALPLCTDKNGNMDFYFINSLSDLNEGSFSIMEPNPEKCRKVTELSNAVCLIPGLSFDMNGYRLGYGKGYYDRFLEKFTYISVGLCYNEMTADKLPHDFYDKKVDYIYTETQAIKL